MQHSSVSLDSFAARERVIEQVASAVLIIPSFRDRVHAYVSTRVGVGSTNYYGRALRHRSSSSFAFS